MMNWDKPIEEHQKYLFKHFTKRLDERYGIDDMTFKEYLNLYNSEFAFLYRLNDRKIYCVVNVNGIDIYLIRDNKYKCFSTCLTPNEHLPIPSYVRGLNISREKFKQDIDMVMSKVVELSQKLSTMDKKVYFTELTDYPKWMYTAGYKGKSHKHTLCHVVQNLYREPPNFITLP